MEYKREEWWHVSGIWWLHLPSRTWHRGQRTSWGGSLPPGAPEE